MTQTLKGKIAHFFCEPVDSPPNGPGPEGVSTLYLLRREVQDCLFGSICEERQALTQPERRRIFASAMVIFAGIDLLARFACSDVAGTGQRFESFLQRFAHVDGRPMRPTEAGAVWAYRNALMHSFGFHFLATDGRIIPLHMYQADRPGPVVRQRGDGWELSVDDLYEMFALAIERYEEALKADVGLQAKFEAAWDKYGTIYVRGAHLA